VQTYPFTESGVERAFRALGDTEEQIVERLTAGGFRGVRNDDGCCPIANYLTTVIEECTSVLVGLDEGYDTETDELAYRISHVELVADDGEGRGRLDVVAPYHVADFVNSFDLNRYPELVEEVSDADAA
jgi:hypothetical protein